MIGCLSMEVRSGMSNCEGLRVHGRDFIYSVWFTRPLGNSQDELGDVENNVCRTSPEPRKWLNCCVSIVLFTTTISKISPLFLLQKDILIHHFLWPGDQEHLSTSQSINNIIFMPKIVPLFSCITHLDKGAYNSSSRTNIRIVITEWLGGRNRIRPTSIVDDE